MVTRTRAAELYGADLRAVTVATAMRSHTCDLQLPSPVEASHLETWTSCPPVRLHFLTVGTLAGRFPPPQLN